MTEVNNSGKDIQQSEDTQPEDNGTQTGRIFTQEEVNKIVSERLARERAKTNEPTEEETKRTAVLEARENKLACREFLLDNNYSKEIIDFIDTSNVKVFKEKAEKLQRLINYGRVAPSFQPYEGVSAPIGEAFQNGVKHIPKNPYSGSDY